MISTPPTTRTTQVVFLATTFQAGMYWACQWGFTRGEVKVVTPDRPDAAFGLRDAIVYLCGPTIDPSERSQRMWELLHTLQAHGCTIYDAHGLGGEPRPVLLDIES